MGRRRESWRKIFCRFSTQNHHRMIFFAPPTAQLAREYLSVKNIQIWKDAMV